VTATSIPDGEKDTPVPLPAGNVVGFAYLAPNPTPGVQKYAVTNGLFTWAIAILSTIYLLFIYLLID
jgi:hypothetical protein